MRVTEIYIPISNKFFYTENCRACPIISYHLLVDLNIFYLLFNPTSFLGKVM